MSWVVFKKCSHGKFQPCKSTASHNQATSLEHHQEVITPILIDQIQLWEDNSMLYGQTPVVQP
jgi:hypothetical protein